MYDIIIMIVSIMFGIVLCSIYCLFKHDKELYRDKEIRELTRELEECRTSLHFKKK